MSENPEHRTPKWMWALAYVSIGALMLGGTGLVIASSLSDDGAEQPSAGPTAPPGPTEPGADPEPEQEGPDQADPSPSASPSAERAALFPLPENRDFQLTVIDTERVESAMGAPFPVDGTLAEVEEWTALAGEGEEQTIGLWTGPEMLAADPFIYRSTAFMSFQSTTPEPERTEYDVYEGSFAPKDLDERFEKDEDQWLSDPDIEDARATLYSFDDDVLFGQDWSSWETPRLPDGEPTLADDESVMRVLTAAADSGAYRYSVSRLALENAEVAQRKGEDPSRIITHGFAFDVADGKPVLTLYYDHATPADARANESVITAELQRLGRDFDGDRDPTIEVDGTLITAEVTVVPDDLGVLPSSVLYLTPRHL